MTDGRVVFITGAGSGIGRALATGFAHDGDQVIGFDRDATGLAETAANGGPMVLTFCGDVTSDEDVSLAVRAGVEQVGPIDVLINNAGVANMGNFLDRSFADWKQVIDINLVGLARCTAAVLGGMLARGHGRVVNVASRAAESAPPRMSAYAASKAGVISFTRAIAREVRDAGAEDVLINALIPGPTNTAIWRRPRPELQVPAEVYPHARFVAGLPPGGPTGRVFYESQDYRVYERFND